MSKKEESIKRILDILDKTYPDAYSELNFKNPFELLISVVLSAQSTDQKVNKVTRDLFAEYPDPKSFLTLSTSELENKIKSIGLYKNKAKNILQTCKILVDEYQSDVPNNYEDLIALPGVGRKTANVVLAVAFDIPAFPVDTHVLRVSNRLHLASSQNPHEVEEQVKKVIPKEHWIDYHHKLIWHGRRICKARKPLCLDCSLPNYCPTYQQYYS